MDPQPAVGAPLTVALQRPPGALVVRPEGELDHDSVGPLREALERAVANPPGRLVVDCGGLDFCDSTGLNLLLRAHAAAEQVGLPLLLAAPGRVVLRMLEITGADQVLAVRATVEDALGDDAAVRPEGALPDGVAPDGLPSGGLPSGGVASDGGASGGGASGGAEGTGEQR
ncbi:STAS domain-containing protein [Kitasatospora sp. NPDC059673]|uniref:STAS domain-containing protein n=1 Tax=Kitasatospora sp. NPDC059673 TaxID=3346901 RepID=UPI0036C6991D